jgi:hypothetical protein
MEEVEVTVRERSQSKGVKPKITARKLRTCVQWQGALKQKKNVQQRLHVIGRPQ